MTYSAQMIEDEMYKALSGIRLPFDGGLYKRGTRPYNSKKEDCVVAFVSGNAEQVSEGIVVVNVYVPDIIANDGQAYKNTTRCLEIEKSMLELDTLLSSCGDILFKAEDMILTIEDADIKQHFVSLKMSFKVLQTKKIGD